MKPCPSCGSELAVLADHGRLGCPDCYRHFHGQLAAILSKFHGSDAHVGMMLISRSPEVHSRREIARFRSLIDLAVEREDYEEAARLRDQIEDLMLQQAREASS